MEQKHRFNPTKWQRMALALLMGSVVTIVGPLWSQKDDKPPMAHPLNSVFNEAGNVTGYPIDLLGQTSVVLQPELEKR